MKLIAPSIAFALFNVIASASISTQLNDDSKNTENVLKAVVFNLPESCDQLKSVGQFDIRTAESFNCMFPSASNEFDRKRVATIMALLMQADKKKLVQSIATSWIKKSSWGPFNQDIVFSDLITVLRIKREVAFVPSKKTSKKPSDSSAIEIEIEAKAVYETFKTFLEIGKDLIVPSPSNTKSIVPKIFNLAIKFEKTEQEKMNSVALIIKTFFSIENDKAKSKEVKRFADAHEVIQTLNKLGEKGEIVIEAWDSYAPIICKYLNENYLTEFGMESVKKHSKTTRKNPDSSDPTELKSNSDGIASKTKNSRATKLIGFLAKSASASTLNTSSIPLNSSVNILKSNKVSFNDSKNLGIVLLVTGLALLLAFLGYAVYLIKMRKNEAFNN